MMNTWDRIDRFEMLVAPILPSAMKMWLMENGFFEAPASRRHHGAYVGGLFDHSYAVTKALLDLTEKLNLKWGSERSPYLIGMFHDLCKIDLYKSTRTEYGEQTWEHNPNVWLKGHGEKSVMLLSQFLTLTEEEIACIRYHMGAFTGTEEWEFYKNAIKKFPNVLWTHTADIHVSYLTGK